MTDTLHIKDFVDSVAYVHLEYREDCILNSVSQIILLGSTYILVDGSKENNCLYLFGTDGNFIRSIRWFGRGPGEYLSITSVDIYNRDSSIYLYDNTGGKVHNYNLSGNYLRSFNSDGIIAGDFKIIGNSEVAFYSPDEPAFIGNSTIPRGLFTYDYDANSFSSVIEHPQTYELIRVFNSNWFTEFGDSIGLLSAYDGNFYRFSNGSFKLIRVFKFPHKDLAIPVSESDLVFKANPVESGNYIFFYAFFKNGAQFHPVLFDKSEGVGSISNGIKGFHRKQLPVFLGSGQSAFLGLVYPDKLEGMELERIEKQLGTKLTHGENPLLAIYFLKK